MTDSGHMIVYSSVCVCVCLGPECGAGCHQHHGFCEQSGECRCRAGWRGAACDQCVPSPDCVHGACEEPGQCICERSWTGARCDRDVHQCSSKPCSGNSTCVETGGGGGGGGYVCLCPLGFTGDSCQLKKGPCSPNPCVNGGRCVRRDPTYTCVCPAHFSGPVCNVSLSVCSSDRCVNGGTCFNDTHGRIRCVCPHRFTGPSCELHISKLKPKPSGPLVTRSQIICFSVLGLLTCLVILVTTGIVFFTRCETWMANAKYSQLVRQQRDQQREQHSLNIILPEKIKLSNYSKHYMSI
uniref:Protein delta homolog 1-like n=1 Tax=Sinocyclocheilus rhinocerous TaxID=307959 RepID=A0A673MRX8_9TELE